MEVSIIGAGMAGLSAAIWLAKHGVSCNLISSHPSVQAQSVLAEGGINAAMDTMSESDTIQEHYEDTLKGGAYLADEDAVFTLTSRAPEIVKWLIGLGVPFNSQDGKLVLRPFGGQHKKRTAYAKSSTGKMIITALIDEARKYEVQGLIQRYSQHVLCDLLIDKGCEGVVVQDIYTKKQLAFHSPVILAYGGLNGLFPYMTTGTTANTGNAAAICLQKGVHFGNLEMIQYHPTTIPISSKRCLISEAARGEGGRLFVIRDGKPWYFMEEKYPQLKNLMPRDVVSREMTALKDTVYLDMTSIPQTSWYHKLSDLKEEITHYLKLNPEKEAIPVAPGIHYFMGGIDTDYRHQTNFENLYAAGECTCRYHGANRLGGNSMLGALLGGRIAAESILEQEREISCMQQTALTYDVRYSKPLANQIGQILLDAMGILRDENSLKQGLDALEKLEPEYEMDKWRIQFAKAMIECALWRKESRGAHYRLDYPFTDDQFQRMSIVYKKDDEWNYTCRDLDHSGGAL
ncbi:MAG: FAD-binding protein [Faecalicoccus sp.]|nr:FAD-binding protein [Faecalicoccus sp.]